MSIETNFSQDMAFKNLSNLYDLTKGWIPFNAFKSIYLGLLFLHLLTEIKNNNLVYSNKLFLIEDHNINFEGHYFVFPKEADFDFLFSKCEYYENNWYFENAFKSLVFNNKHILDIVFFKGICLDFDRYFNNNQGNLFIEKIFYSIKDFNFKIISNNVPVEAGDIFELYISYFSILDSKESGQSYTQNSINDLLAKLIPPSPGNKVYDPACGTGSLLLKFKESLLNNYKNETCLLYGQEKNITTFSIAKMNMILHNDLTHKIRLGDTLLDPKFIDNNQNLMQFDIVISNPPFTLSNWGYEVLQYDKFNRFGLGMPPKSKGDFAFILHMINSINDNGRMAIIVPNGVLFRGGSEREIRKNLIEKNLIDGVISLPEKLLFGTSIPIAIIIFKKDKIGNDIKFIDASNEYVAEKNLNYLSKNNIEKIVEAYQDENKNNNFIHRATINEIRENEYNLNISRYIVEAEKNEDIDLEKLIEERNDLKNELCKLENEMKNYLKKLI